MEPLESIGKRVKQIRLENHLNQDAFGAKIGYPKSTISKYENGFLIPRTAALKALREEFGVDLNWLVLGEEPKQQADEDLVKEVQKLSKENKELHKELIEATTHLVDILSEKK